MSIERITDTDHKSNRGIRFIGQTKEVSEYMSQTIYDINNNGIVDNVDAVIVEILATAVITKYQLITKDGLVADSANVLHTHKVVGIALNDTAIGFICQTQIFGTLVNPLWSWTGYNLFLNGTAISETFPTTGFNKHLATVKNSTTILVDIKNSILL